jgi:hypothetical protein
MDNMSEMLTKNSVKLQQTINILYCYCFVRMDFSVHCGIKDKALDGRCKEKSIRAKHINDSRFI